MIQEIEEIKRLILASESVPPITLGEPPVLTEEERLLSRLKWWGYVE